MCTVSWSLGAEGATLCFNRDERRERSPAWPPAMIDRSGERCLAAIDPPSGGTWLAVNRHGLCAFVLNNYACERARTDLSDAPSRGKLPFLLASCRSVAEGRATLERFDPSPFRPFNLGLLDRGSQTLYEWTGGTWLERGEIRDFLSSSSYRSREVEAYRATAYESWRRAAGEHPSLDRRLAFHRDRSHPDPAFNPTMIRKEAMTRSLSAVEIGPATARYRFWPRREDGSGWAEVREASLDLTPPLRSPASGI